MRVLRKLVAGVFLTSLALGCSAEGGLSPTAQKALWILNGTTTFEWGGTVNRIRVEKCRNGYIAVDFYPARTGYCYALPILVSTDGDVADLYRRVTGKEHPTLKGDLSEDYQEFLKKDRW